MSWTLPAVVIFQPPDGFEVPPVTTAPPVGAQPPAGAQPPPAGQPPAGAQPPPVVGAPPVAAQAVTIGPLPVTTQDPVRLQPVLVTGQAPGGNVTIQVDHGPPIHAEPGPARDPGLLGALGFSATVVIPDSPGPHVITATAVDDANSLNPSASVTVWVGPAFAIAPPALLVELYYPHPTLDLPATLVGEMQQHLTWLQALAGKYGLTVAGPAFTLGTPPNSPPVLRIGLWITDSSFATVPASPPDQPLPALSDTQAASCFGTTPLILSPDPPPDAIAAVLLPTTTLQTVADAASPKIVAAGARHGITVSTLTASTSPPNTVILTADCTFPAGDPGTISVTETLGTQTVTWESGEPAMPTQVHVPAVTKTSPSSSDDSISNIFELLDLTWWARNIWDNVVGTVASGDAASKVSGIIGPLLASLPYAYPFPNNFIPSIEPTDTTPPDFPVLSLDWTSFGATDAGVVGGIQWSLGNRAQDDVVLTIEGQTYITADPVQFGYNPQAEFTWTLQNLDPDSFTWTLTGDAQAQGIIVASPFTQAGTFTVPINLPSPPNVTRGTYQFTLSVSASETCASDPTKVLTAAWSSLINLRLVPSQ
jgi:hypothetical protein